MTNNNKHMIEIEHLQKDFSGTQVLKDISFEVAAGEVVAMPLSDHQGQGNRPCLDA